MVEGMTSFCLLGLLNITTIGILGSITKCTGQSIYNLHIEQAGYNGYHYHGEVTDQDVTGYI